jgi:exonuclease SbcC
MHVKIVGFKCHLDTSYDITSGSMTLLKGESGAGKSTILQAIFWALYGSMRGIYNNSGQIKKCSVTLQINHLLIYRQKRPELLKVTILNPNDHTEKTYEDAVAQQIIDQAFGTKDLWKACSYISQKERCSLLSGSAADRLTLLNQLSFHQDNPKDYIMRIDQELKGINKSFTESQGGFTTQLNLYTQELNSRPVTVTLSDQDIEILEREISQLEADITKLHQDVLTHERNLGSYNMICNQLSQYRSRLDSIKVINFIEQDYKVKVDSYQTEISQIRDMMVSANNYITLKNQRDHIQTQIQTIQSQIQSTDKNIEYIQSELVTTKLELDSVGIDYTNIEVNQNMVWNTNNQENTRKQNISHSAELGVEYDQTVINAIISELQGEITIAQNISRNIQTYNRLKSLQTQLKSYPFTEPTNECISDLEKQNQDLILEISEMKKGLELLKCPECLKSLRYVNNQLVSGDRDPVDPKDIAELETKYRNNIHTISSYRSILQLQSQIQSVESQLDGVDISELEKQMKNPPNIHIKQQKISALARIQIVDPPKYSSKLLKTILSYKQSVNNISDLQQSRDKLISQLDQLTVQLNNIVLPTVPSYDNTELNNRISHLEGETTKLNQHRQNYLDQQSTINQINSNIKSLQDQKGAIEKLLNPNARTIYDTTKEMISELKKRYREALYAQTMVQKQKQLEIKRQEVIKLNEDLTSLQRLKQNAITVECKQLQDTVDTINQTLGDILPLFFNEPIEMVLQLYKTLKTKKQVKPGLNIVIKYKGVEYDNINQLSGGEGDRLSLALVLSLNQVSNSPVVLLDEVISSLDGPVKEACVQAMKTLNKTTICVDHEGVEGHYDKTILVNH